MTEYMTEEEQLALLKQWIKEYSKVIITGLLLSAVAVFGWRWWHARQQRIMSEASTLYDEMLAARTQDNTTIADVNSEKLVSQYSNTAYAQIAALMQARNAVKNADYDSAEKQLRWVLNNSKSASFRQIARLRLARILINQDKAKESLALLDKVEDKTFSGMIDEIKGDAWLALNDKEQAREAYQQALVDLPNAETTRPVLQMKLDNLATLA